MSRLCPNPKENLPIDAYFIVLNNFESIEKEIRKEIVRTMLDSKLKVKNKNPFDFRTNSNISIELNGITFSVFDYIAVQC